ncbi:MAG: leucine-rich repeat domain-containing protein [Clostridiales bacterium]|nr:MAG: leucine-rich repeat domain-containing protein [Clostridiales bacterium]
MNVDFNKPLALKVPEGAPTEKTFAGWWYGEVQYTGADGTSVDYKTITDPEFIKNGIKLTAKWVPIEYFVIENGVIVGIDENKAKKGDSYKTEFTINFDDAVHAIKDGAFKNNKFIRKITIKGNIQTIGEEAFANSNIEVVVFEGNFKGLAIGAGAFRNCVRITAIALPDNVEQIGDNVFEGCYNLTTLAYSAEIPLGRLFTTVNPQNDNWYPKAVQGGVTYYLPKKLKEIVVTNTATAIADYAFQNASQLTKVTLATAKTINLTRRNRQLCFCKHRQHRSKSRQRRNYRQLRIQKQRHRDG